MKELVPEDLFSLERYSVMRDDFRSKVISHKKNRRLPIGDNATLYFEDSLTIKYQIQEMLRIERIFEASGIQEELQAYNPLIPDGNNWKATFMIEIEDEQKRRKALASMIGIEQSVWIKVSDMQKIRPIANEDMERTAPGKTSSVHFLRFELGQEAISALKERGTTMSVGIDHEFYRHEVAVVPQNIYDALIADLD